MKLCLIGDSHLGHIKPVWDARREDFPGWSAGFKVERTYGTEPLTIRSADGGEQIVLEDIRVAYSPEVAVGDWDVFIVFGMHFSVAAMAKTYPAYRSDAFSPRSGVYALSDQGYRDAMWDHYWNSKAGRVIQSVQAYSDRPIVYVQQPNPLSWVRNRDEDRLREFGLIDRQGDAPRLAERYGDMLTRLEGMGVAVVRQPAATVIDAIFTKSEFGLADPSDTSPESLYTKGDYFHMGTAYGHVVLDQVAEQVRELV